VGAAVVGVATGAAAVATAADQDEDQDRDRDYHRGGDRVADDHPVAAAARFAFFGFDPLLSQPVSFALSLTHGLKD